MKKYIFILISLGTCIQNSFAQNFPWADSAYGTMLFPSNGPTGYAICTDDSSNVFVTGAIYAGFSLKKYKSNGALEWSKSSYTNFGVTADQRGNCYTTGSYFFEKYSSLGVLIRKDSGRISSNNAELIGNTIAYDGGKYVYIAGNFNAYSGATVYFGVNPITFGANSMGFILKCDTAGDVIWAKSSQLVNSLSEYSPIGINVASNGLIYVTGYFADSVLLGGVPLYTTLSQTMAFVACYDTNGNVVWVHKTNRYSSYGHSISSDGAGNIYFTGSANGNCFISKYMSNGDSVWWRECNSGNAEANSWGYGISTNYSGTSFITGGYEGVPFGTLHINTSLLLGGDVDIFMVKYDSLGNAVWGYDPNDTLPNSLNNFGCAVTTDNSGCNFYFTGVTQTPAIFGTNIIYALPDGFYVTKLQNGCALGLENPIESKETIKVYPNPFISSTTIIFSESGKHQLELEDISGRTLRQFECEGQQYELQRGSLASGMYFIKVTDEQNDVSVSKILIQ